ncbi:MAG: adenylate/guanylate cyclase domain-containing protein [Paracoccaceae bacterium]
MSDTRAQRRLAAILAADVAGYSRMMGEDEAGTISALREVWATRFNPAVAAHGGRVVKTMGDGALVEFASAVDAVECGLAIQAAMAAFNGARDGRGPIVFRVGINLGDILIDGDDILGDGVNVAARLESQAPLGGILVSDGIHAQVRGKVGADFADAGELSLKNIAVPVRAWRWGGEAGPAAAGAAKPAELEEAGPSIAVLPFNNMSGDPEQEYFSDGISEDIITDLSKVGGLMVIARNSSFAYKGKAPDIRVVGRELGVTSVLEGSIRKGGNRVRINAQLIDARNGAHLWADRFDRDLTDIFEVQDEVTQRIVEALRVTLKPAEKALLAEAPTRSVEAHDLFLRGRELLFGPAKSAANFALAVDRLRQAIAADPGYALPYSGLGMAYTHDFTNHWSDTEDPLSLAGHFATLGVEKGPSEPFAHYVLGVVKVWQCDLDAARALEERALALSPNFAPAFGALGLAEVYLGLPLEGAEHIRRGMLLDPGFSHQSLHFLGLAQFMAGDLAASAESFRERIRLSPGTDLSRGFLASVLGNLGEADEARRVWEELKAINPKYTMGEHLARSPFRREADVATIRDGLAKAGIAD